MSAPVAAARATSIAARAAAVSPEAAARSAARARARDLAALSGVQHAWSGCCTSRPAATSAARTSSRYLCATHAAGGLYPEDLRPAPAPSAG
ncbi:hypothetical protein [Sorangium cellulosum]|uniref:hypothetical protein n=1 Tax=Sorangium cellulosum TaxID=56 RepID=UPI001331306A|nr:hypothetical protein [Sorangium cellulosum]